MIVNVDKCGIKFNLFVRFSKESHRKMAKNGFEKLNVQCQDKQDQVAKCETRRDMRVDLACNKCYIFHPEFGIVSETVFTILMNCFFFRVLPLSNCAAMNISFKYGVKRLNGVYCWAAAAAAKKPFRAVSTVAAALGTLDDKNFSMLHDDGFFDETAPLLFAFEEL